ncbi:NADH-ubiquinone oxidoreductase-F iron-sulfur binding region domain-containing protein [Flexivirga sp.]|uniref:NADH-ubiquinone oxidoreductase-F iron-sulfur binding region domain-containing protein n=1 Tax=Flexivirga sp. TaxID=1962927 RepID=UPI003F7FC882
MNLIDLLEEAGLTGRGGAMFPTSVKLRAAFDARADLIVNACDGEVGTHKDAMVVAEHLRELEHGAGLVARKVHWAAHRGSDTEDRLLDAGLPVLSLPARYVASEESALVNLLHGGLARPVMRRAPIARGARDSRGRRLPPTLVLNAETVWRIGQIERYGPGWFRSVGTPDEPGPRLVTIGGSVERPGVYETAAGVPLRELLTAAGAFAVGAVGLGGLGGGWLSAGDAWSETWSDAALAAHGLRTGTGAISVLEHSACPLLHVAQLARFAAGESAGQCGPCMFGVPAVAAQVARLADGVLPSAEFAQLQQRLQLLSGRGACRYPDGVAGFLSSALRTFRADVSAHLAGACIVMKERAGAAG